MVHAGDLGRTLAGDLGQVEEDLAHRALVLVLRAIFFDENLAIFGTTGASPEGEFSVNHFLETVVQPREGVMSVVAHVLMIGSGRSHEPKRSFD